MDVTFTNYHKARAASVKHFDNAYTMRQMKLMAAHVFTNYTMIGVSDITNPGFNEPAVILWHPFKGTMLQITVDAKDFRDGKCDVLTMYPVNNVELRTRRFNMQPR